MNLMVMFKQVKQGLADIAELDKRCTLLDETTVALESRLKALEAQSLKGGSDGTVSKPRRGRPPKVARSD